MESLNQLITVDKEIAAGQPVFAGTRVTVHTLFDYLEEESLNDFLIGFPSVSRAQAEAGIELAMRNDLLPGNNRLSSLTTLH